jgi:hypothetical protein
MAAYEVESHPNIRVGRDRLSAVSEQFVLEVLQISDHSSNLAAGALRIRRSFATMSSPWSPLPAPASIAPSVLAAAPGTIELLRIFLLGHGSAPVRCSNSEKNDDTRKKSKWI